VIFVGDVKGSTYGTPGATTALPLNQQGLTVTFSDHERRVEDSSRSQHGELAASRTGGTHQLNAHSELRIQILVRANSAEKVPDT
jgi:hypothetical protein